MYISLTVARLSKSRATVRATLWSIHGLSALAYDSMFVILECVARLEMLTLGELALLAGALEAVLFALALAAVAAEQFGTAERSLEVGVE